MTSREAPVLIGALGGSGTRVVARMARHAGVFMGSRLNEAEDSEPIMNFYDAWMRPYLESAGELKGAEREAAEACIREALERHLSRMTGEVLSWGIKVPRTILMLSFWHQQFPDLSFVHVVRDGLDMAYSADRNQLRMVGDLVLTDEEQRYSPPLRAIAYWQRVNMAAADFGESRLGRRYLRLRFEDLCSRPAWAYERLCQLLNEPDAAGRLAGAVREVRVPKTIGRWRTHPGEELHELRRVGEAALDRFGYRGRD